jgi:hypothetical protein
MNVQTNERKRQRLRAEKISNSESKGKSREILLKKLFKAADIDVNGPKLWDIQVYDGRFYRRVLRDKSLGLGESYMEGWWDCSSLDENDLPSAALRYR